MLKQIPRALLLSLALPSLAFAQAQPPASDRAFPVAYFSFQRAFSESDDGKSADKKLASIRTERAREIDARNLKLKELRRTLEESGSTLDEAVRDQREREIEKVEVDLQRLLEDAQAQVLDVQAQLEAAFAAKLRPIVASVARERGVLLVFDEDAGQIVWSAATLDITADVVSRLNKP